MNGVLVPLPLDVQAIARRLTNAALQLEEDASACAMNAVPDNFDDMLLSMRVMFDALLDAYREITR